MRHRSYLSIAVIAVAAVVLLAVAPRVSQADAVYGWGQGGYGNLGNGFPANLSIPTLSPALSSGATGVGAGSGFSVAIKDGSLYGWGNKQYGQYGDNGSNKPNDTFTPRLIVSLPAGGVTAVAAGGLNSMVIQNGGVFVVGDNGYGQVGNGTNSNPGTFAPAQGLSSGVTKIAAGSYFSMAVKNGAAYTWGYNGFGAIGDNTLTDRFVPTPVPGLGSGVTDIATASVGNGTLAAFAIKDGGLYSWGTNVYGELGTGNTTDHYTPAIVPTLSSGVTDVAGGASACLAIMNGQVYSWGKNDFGQLGNGTTTNRFTPTLIPGLSNIIQVAAGGYSSYALAGDGSLWVWGLNGYGELGLGDTNNRLSPTHLLPPSGQVFTSISVSSESVLATVSVPVPLPEALPGGLVLLAILGIVSRMNSHRTSNTH